MLVQVVYITYTPLCRWYTKHIHHFAKRLIVCVVSQRNAARPSSYLYVQGTPFFSLCSLFLARVSAD